MELVSKSLKWLGIGLYAVCALIIVMFITPVGGWKALDVLTGSMRPAIQPGALVLVHKVPVSSIKVGNIVTYTNPHNPQMTITHRVVKISKARDGVTTITVKGDANKVPDPPFTSGYLDGRVALIVPGAGRSIGWLHSAWGLAALVIIPGLFVIWSEIKRLREVLQTHPRGQKRPLPAGSYNRLTSPAALTGLRKYFEALFMPGRRRPVRVSVDTILRVRRTGPTGTRARRHFDHVSPLAVLPLAGFLILAGVGVTHAAVVGVASLIGNSFSATTSVTTSPTPTPTPSPTISPSPSPSPTASPCPTSVSISNTGPGSTNTVTCKSSSTSKSSSTNNTTVTNINHQSGSTGSATNGSSGSVTNTNTTTTTITTY